MKEPTLKQQKQKFLEEKFLELEGRKEKEKFWNARRDHKRSCSCEKFDAFTNVDTISSFSNNVADSLGKRDK